VSAHGLRSVEHNGGLDAYLLKASTDQLSPQLQKLKRDLVKSRAAAAA
jgi:large subunit ribosomal protein L28